MVAKGGGTNYVSGLPPKPCPQRMNQTRAFALICAAILACAAAGLALLMLLGDLGLTPHGYIALTLGVLVTLALTMVLMGLVFFSSRSGKDHGVYSHWKDPQP